MQINIDLTKYQKIKEIKRGGYGEIYQIRKISTSEIYVAKIIKINQDSDFNKTCIDHEIQILMNVKHPTIINMLGFTLNDFEGNKNVTILMNYYKNGSLLDLLTKAQKGVAPTEFNDTIRQIIITGIARGMKYLHDRRIIHRDLNPNNVLLDDDLHPLISDFGLSKYYDYDTNEHSHNEGTQGYMAPEYILGPIYNEKVDVFSFGILMYEVVMDQKAYKNMSSLNYNQYIIQMINNKIRPTFIYPVKQSIRDLIEKCWSEDPNDRPTFEYIFNKLANLDNKDVDDPDSYFLDGVEINGFNSYVESILDATDSVEYLINHLKRANKENKELNANNEELNLERIKLKSENDKLKKEIQKLENEITKIKKDNQNNKGIQQESFNKPDIQNNYEEEMAFFEEEEEENINQEEENDDNDDNIDDEIIDFNNINDTMKENFIKYKISKKSGKAQIERSQNVHGNVVIKKSIKTLDSEYTIIGISEGAFEGTNIETLGFEEDSEIQYFGDFIFKNSKITKVCIPRSLRKVTKDSFNNAKELVSIEINKKNRYFININGFIIYNENPKTNQTKTIIFSPPNISGECSIPNDVTIIGKSSFIKRENLKSIAIGTKLQKIESNAFFNCQNLEKISIKETPSLFLGQYSFARSQKLKTVEIESQEIEIGEKSFSDCVLLETVLVSKVNNIILQSYAFKNCSHLKNISFCYELEQHNTNSTFDVSKIKSIKIDQYCFLNCIALVSVDFSDIENIDLSSKIFEGCINLDSVKINNPKKIKIPKECFYNLPKLKSLHFEAEDISIDIDFINNCPLLTNITIIEQKDLILHSDIFKNCPTIISLILNTSSKLQLCSECFKYLTKLQYIKTSFKNIAIHDKCFDYCQSLIFIKFQSKDDISFDKELFLGCKNLKVLKINSESNILLKDQFMNDSSNLQKLCLSSKTFSIGNHCFLKCKQLNKFYIKKSGDILIIQNMFSNFKNLQKIKIQSKGNDQFEQSHKICFALNCFSELKSINKIKFKGVDVTIFNDCIKNCQRLQEICFKSSENVVIKEKQFTGMTSLRIVKINSLANINLESGCFQNTNLENICISGKDVIIEDHCFYKATIDKICFLKVDNLIIGPSAFQKCKKLSNINITAFLKIIIGDYCFKETNLVNAAFQCNGNIIIGENCFEKCNSFKIDKASEIILKNNAFYNCGKLQEIFLKPTTKLIIFDNCFYGDKNLKEINIQCNNKFDDIVIGSKSFYNCSSLESISFVCANSVIFEENAFFGCKNLRNITITASKEFQAGMNCFTNCNDKSFDLSINSGKVIIDKNCFKSTNISTLTIAAQSEIILKEKAFSYCTKLNNVNIKLNGKVTISNECFYKDQNLTQVIIEGNEISTGTYSFSKCSSLNQLSFNKAENIILDNYSFSECNNISALAFKVDFRFTAKYCCFNEMKNLNKVTIDCSRVDIGDFCFWNCSKLISINFLSTSYFSFYNTSFCGTNKDIQYNFNENVHKLQHISGNIVYPKINI
ncbi:hypothetical protein M9Y10_039859 [Tritrichomonas musculus]|uniref:Protein kinase domain-containing protein n=1 Tax=Tritrichomonas musculus TaxID=1915356 RepID=A0ABR2GQP1_9EUKA